MNEYHFNTEAARLYGVNEAIFLHSLAFWVEKNRANGKHLHEGRYWTYNTQEAFAELFPFWTRRQVERIIASCKDQGAILIDNFNEDRTNRTKWYALTDAALNFYFPKTVECIAPNGEMVEPQGIGSESVDTQPIAPNGEMHSTKRCKPLHQTVKCNKGNSCLPDNNPPISPEGEEGKKKLSLTKDVRYMLNGYVGQDAELAQALAELMRNRISLKAINDAPSVKRLLNRLDKLSGDDRQTKLELLDDAIQSSWKTVYEPRGGKSAKPAAPARVVEYGEVPTW